MTIRHMNPGPRMSQATIHAGVVYLSGQIAAPGEDVAVQAAQRRSVASAPSTSWKTGFSTSPATA